MKRITLALTVLVSLAFAAAAKAADPPFPGNKVNGVFVAAQTVTATGAVSDQFKPGHKVVFRAFAIDTKAHKLLTKKFGKLTKHNAKLAKTSLRSFFVRIPLVGDRQFTYRAVPKGIDPRYRWAVSWRVPTLYPLGVVQFQVFAKMWNKQSGTFSQVPVQLSQLTITTSPQRPFGPGPTVQGSASSTNLDMALFADAVAGHSRPVACTQTNVFKIGEMVIVRAFGYEFSDGAVLEGGVNVTDAHFTVPGSPTEISTPLNWGSHPTSTSQKESYWTGAWTIPSDYPIGDIQVQISFTTLLGKTGTVDYPITIIPAT